MTENNPNRQRMSSLKNLKNTYWKIANEMRGAMIADQFCDEVLLFYKVFTF